MEKNQTKIGFKTAISLFGIEIGEKTELGYGFHSPGYILNQLGASIKGLHILEFEIDESNITNSSENRFDFAGEAKIRGISSF